MLRRLEIVRGITIVIAKCRYYNFIDCSHHYTFSSVRWSGHCFRVRRSCTSHAWLFGKDAGTAGTMRWRELSSPGSSRHDVSRLRARWILLLTRRLLQARAEVRERCSLHPVIQDKYTYHSFGLRAFSGTAHIQHYLSPLPEGSPHPNTSASFRAGS